MCLAMYMFTKEVLPESVWDKSNPDFYIQRVFIEEDKRLSKWPCGQKNTYYIGSHQGCGCGWAAVSEFDSAQEKQKKIQIRQALVDVLKTIRVSGSRLVVCWDGDQGDDLLEKITISFSQILDQEFDFEEMRQYVFA